MPNHSVAALPPCQAKTTSCHSTVAAAVTVTASNSGRKRSLHSRFHNIHSQFEFWNLDPDHKYLFCCPSDKDFLYVVQLVFVFSFQCMKHSSTEMSV